MSLKFTTLSIFFCMSNILLLFFNLICTSDEIASHTQSFPSKNCNDFMTCFSQLTVQEGVKQCWFFKIILSPWKPSFFSWKILEKSSKFACLTLYEPWAHNFSRYAPNGVLNLELARKYSFKLKRIWRRHGSLIIGLPVASPNLVFGGNSSPTQKVNGGRIPRRNCLSRPGFLLM